MSVPPEICLWPMWKHSIDLYTVLQGSHPEDHRYQEGGSRHVLLCGWERSGQGSSAQHRRGGGVCSCHLGASPTSRPSSAVRYGPGVSRGGLPSTRSLLDQGRRAALQQPALLVSTTRHQTHINLTTILISSCHIRVLLISRGAKCIPIQEIRETLTNFINWRKSL